MAKKENGGSRSPSWGAWIEIEDAADDDEYEEVAPPRGERGLKSAFIEFFEEYGTSLPLVGSVD